jgi:hypothetical protein
MTNTDNIRDRLSVGQGHEGWIVWSWDDEEDRRRLGIFPDEELAWGVVSLVIEYHEQHGYDVPNACHAALQEYHEAMAGSRDTHEEGDPGELARQDHRAAMAVA